MKNDIDKDDIDKNNSDIVSELKIENIFIFRNAQFEEA